MKRKWRDPQWYALLAMLPLFYLQRRPRYDLLWRDVEALKQGDRETLAMRCAWLRDQGADGIAGYISERGVRGE